MTVESSSSDNDEDEDDDLTNTTTTTTDSVASTSSKSGAANVPTTRTVSATVPNIEIGTDVKPSSSLSTHKLFSPSKADKKPKIEIKSTLLADWSDHYTSEDDDEEKSLPPPKPPTPPTSSLPVQALATTTETNQNIPSTTAELTSENKPKYRNIPKKDRRADVLREFYTDVSSVAPPPSTSDAVLKVPTVDSKRESNVIVLDSDDSDTDKMSIKMEKTSRNDSKTAPPDGDSKTEPNPVAILSDAVKPIKKRDIGRQQLDAVMDETNGQLNTITDETLATASSSVIVTVNAPAQSEQINISQSDEMVAIGSVTPTTGCRIRGRKKEDTVRPTSRRSGRIKGLENGMFLSFMIYLNVYV